MQIHPRITFIVCSALIMATFPVFSLLIPILNFLTYFLLLIPIGGIMGKIFFLSPNTLIPVGLGWGGQSALYVDLLPWMSLVVWAIIGAFWGYALFRIRKNRIPNLRFDIGAVFSTLIVQLGIGLVLLLILASLG